MRSVVNEDIRSMAGFCVVFALFFGPIGLLLSFFLSGFVQYGLKFRANNEFLTVAERTKYGA